MAEPLTPTPDQVPRWRRVLRRAIEEASLSEVARRTGYSASTLSEAARGLYKGRTDRVERAVLEAYAPDQVACPVLGPVTLGRCAEERRRPFSAASPQAVRLYRTCPTCIHNPDSKED